MSDSSHLIAVVWDLNRMGFSFDMFERLLHRQFRLRISARVSPSWVSNIIEGIETLPSDKHFTQRRRGIVALPRGSTSGRAFIKVFHHASPRHQNGDGELRSRGSGPDMPIMKVEHSGI